MTAMRHIARETVEATLTRLIKAMDTQTPVTIAYTKADGTESVRTIEIHDFVVTAAGDITIKAMDRETGEQRTFRLDRVRHYLVHRGASYTVPRDEQPADSKPSVPSLREPLLDSVADLIVEGTGPVDLLAFALAA